MSFPQSNRTKMHLLLKFFFLPCFSLSLFL